MQRVGLELARLDLDCALGRTQTLYSSILAPHLQYVLAIGNIVYDGGSILAKLRIVRRAQGDNHGPHFGMDIAEAASELSTVAKGKGIPSTFAGGPSGK